MRDVSLVVGSTMPALLLGLRQVFEDAGGSVVADAGTPDELVAACTSRSPSVVVTDAHVLGEALESARTQRVLVLTDDAVAGKRRMLLAGVRGFVPFAASRVELVAAAGSVARGDVVLDPGLTQQLLMPQDAGDQPLLTRREAAVLQLSADGLTQREIGRELHIAVTTVKTHVANAKAKLATASRVVAVRRATELGLLERAVA